MLRKFIRNDNRGLSLLELLVAVVILGIVVSPLLHTFVTSAQTSRKSRQYGDATTAAQNIAESIEAADLDMLLTNASVLDSDEDSISGAAFYAPSEGKYVEAAGPVKDSSDCYYIGLGVDSGVSKFDALVKLDASAVINTKPVTEYTELLSVSQSSFANDPDADALTAFQEKQGLVTGIVSGSPSLARTITITVGKAQGSGDTVTYPITFTYSYQGSFRYTDSEGAVQTESVTSSFTSTVNINGAPRGEDADPAFSLYFFFNTFYGAGSVQDTIVINNTANGDTASGKDLPFNLFLVRQKPADTTSESTYKPQILQYETYGLGSTTNADTGVVTYLNACTIYTNMDTNFNTDTKLTTVNGTFYKVYQGSSGSTWYYPGTSEPELVASDTLDRLITVTVSLYEDGAAAGGFTGDPVATLTATKLD